MGSQKSDFPLQISQYNIMQSADSIFDPYYYKVKAFGSIVSFFFFLTIKMTFKSKYKS